MKSVLNTTKYDTCGIYVHVYIRLKCEELCWSNNTRTIHLEKLGLVSEWRFFLTFTDLHVYSMHLYMKNMKIWAHYWSYAYFYLCYDFETGGRKITQKPDKLKQLSAFFYITTIYQPNSACTRIQCPAGGASDVVSHHCPVYRTSNMEPSS